MRGPADRGGRSAGETTHPAVSTGQKRPESLELAIRWVFPTEKLTVVTGEEKLLGRSEHCHTVLPGSETSREHASVWQEGPLRMIRDRRSVNGVFANGVRRELTPLNAGDVVRVGEGVGLVVHVESRHDSPGFGEISPGWYGGARLRHVVEPARAAATSELPIVIQGETGAGKEGLAAAIHRWSGRHGALVAVNCAALPENLVEAELFGYRQGAFTGATRQSLGHVRAAQGGTLLLDEIVELPLAVQAKLLRALDERAVYPLGESSPVPVDFRVIAAAQEPLASMVSEKRFRADLKARLDGLTIDLPPLRDRREDVVPLFFEFLRASNGGVCPATEPRLIEQLLLHDWPLNVRELSMLAQLLVNTRPGQTLKRSHLPSRFQEKRPREAAPSSGSQRTPTDDPESIEALQGALRQNGGNMTRAARALGITRARAYRLAEALELSTFRAEGDEQVTGDAD
jgi:transcriptional regulator with AAA-type ATPase domain